MDKKEKFENFLESLKGNGHNKLLESVKKGFRVCFENIQEFLKYDDIISQTIKTNLPKAIFMMMNQGNHDWLFINKDGDSDLKNWNFDLVANGLSDITEEEAKLFVDSGYFEYYTMNDPNDSIATVAHYPLPKFSEQWYDAFSKRTGM